MCYKPACLGRASDPETQALYSTSEMDAHMMTSKTSSKISNNSTRHLSLNKDINVMIKLKHYILQHNGLNKYIANWT